MCSITEKCILCIKTDKEIIKIFSDRGLKLKIADILLNHFWFSVNFEYFLIHSFDWC